MPRKRNEGDYDDWIQLGALWKTRKKGKLGGQLDGDLELADLEKAYEEGYRLFLAPAGGSGDRGPDYRIWLTPPAADGGRRRKPKSRGTGRRRDRDDDDDRGRRRSRKRDDEYEDDVRGKVDAELDEEDDDDVPF
jgi:hypothetical protein